MRLYVDERVCKSTLIQQSNHDLIKEVVRFSSASPEVVAALNGETGVLARQIVSPTFEAISFMEKTAALGLRQTFLTYRNDLFTPSANVAKRRLGKLRVNVRELHFRSITVVDFQRFEYQRLKDVQTHGGMTLEDFHLRAWHAEFGSLPSNVLDFSEFYGADRPAAYYERFFALFTCLGILFENYPIEGSEQRFTEDVVAPAFEATKHRFRSVPVIVNTLPDGEEMNEIWDSLPTSALPLARTESRDTTKMHI